MEKKTGLGIGAAVAGSVALGVAAAGRAVVRARRRVGELERTLRERDHTGRADLAPGTTPEAAVAASNAPGGGADDLADELVDAETGLLDGRYFRVALDQRVAAARRKLQPLAVMLIEIDTERQSSLDFVEQTAVVHETLREADTICRIGAARLGLILEEATEFGAVFAIERIRMAVNRAGGDEEHLWAGVAGYPSHALDACQLMQRAEAALERARSSGRGWVRVARTE